MKPHSSIHTRTLALLGLIGIMAGCAPYSDLSDRNRAIEIKPYHSGKQNLLGKIYTQDVKKQISFGKNLVQIAGDIKEEEAVPAQGGDIVSLNFSMPVPVAGMTATPTVRAPLGFRYDIPSPKLHSAHYLAPNGILRPEGTQYTIVSEELHTGQHSITKGTWGGDLTVSDLGTGASKAAREYISTQKDAEGRTTKVNLADLIVGVKTAVVDAGSIIPIKALGQGETRALGDTGYELLYRQTIRPKGEEATKLEFALRKSPDEEDFVPWPTGEICQRYSFSPN